MPQLVPDDNTPLSSSHPAESKAIYDYEYEAVPLQARKSWYVIALIWLAVGIDISGLFLGAFLSNGLDFNNAIFATLAGSAILGLLGALCANVGYSSGLSTTLLSSTVFGRFGGKFIGIISAVSLVGWFAFQLDFFGEMLQKSLSYYAIQPGRLPILLFGTILMTTTAVWGVRALGKLSVISVPLMVGLIVLGMFKASHYPDPVQTMVISNPLTLGSAISYVISIWIMAAVMAPDIARYAKSRKDTLLGAGLGFLLGNSATILVALFLTKLTGSDALVDVFFKIGFGLSAIIVLVFAQWTTNSNNLVSASLGLSVAVQWISRPLLVIIMACVGLALAYNGMINNFAQFLSILGVLIAPIAGVYLAQYYLLDASRLTLTQQTVRGLEPIAALSWGLGSLVSLLTSEDFAGLFQITTVSALDGVLSAMLAYWLLQKSSNFNKTTNKANNT
ncbi:MAG: purine-cytosine permease family protein [Enterobacteriaceae bacterium]